MRKTAVLQVIPVGETYSFTNTSDEPYNLLSTSQDRDYVLYAKDGSITSYVRDAYFTALNIPAGSTIKITSRYSSFECAGLYENFDVIKQVTPVFKKVTIPVGETYSFTNTGDESYNLLSTSQDRDYVLYAKDGSITSYVKNSYFTALNIPAGSTIKITSRYSSFECAGLYENFDLKKQVIPVFKKVTIPAGETYSFTNTGDEPYNLLSSSGTRDYTIYNALGDVVSSKTNIVNMSSLEILPGNKITVISRNSDLEYDGLYEKFTLTRDTSSTPAFTEITPGKTYSYTNNGSVAFELSYFGGASADYIVYAANNSMVSYGVCSTSKITIPAGGKAIVSAAASNYYSLELPSTVAMVEVNDPVFRKADTHLGETYRFTNTSATALNIFTNGNSYDMIIYNSNSTINTYETGKTAQTVSIPAGCYADITSNSANLSINALYDKFTVVKQAAQIFNHDTIPIGETYQFTNTSMRDYNIFTNGHVFDYIIYNLDGSIKSYATEATNTTLLIPSEGWIKITALGSLSVSSMKAQFSVERAAAATFKHQYLSLGETYIVENTSMRDHKIFINTDVYDYVTYDEDGNVTGSGMDSTAKEITVLSGYRMAMTTLSSNLSIAALSEVFTLSKRNYPALRRVTMFENASGNFSNSYKSTLPLYNSSNTVGYAIYNQSGAVTEAHNETTKSNMNIPGGGKVEVTVKSSNITFAGVYEYFSHSSGDYFAEISGNTLSISDNKITGTLTVKVTNNTEDTPNISAILVFYNANSKMEFIKTETDIILDEGENTIHFTNINANVSNVTAYPAKVFIWNANTMEPLSGPIVFEIR